MIEKIAANLIGQMIRDKLVDESHREWYEYALISLSERFLTIGTILLISIWMKVFVPTLFFLFFFLELRKRTGGFHFNSFYQCYLATMLTYFMLVVCNPFFVKHLNVLGGTFLLAVCMIMLIGTVNHPNIHMDALELTEAKKAARILVLLEGSVIYCFIILNADKILISYMMIAVILCASLQSIAKIIKQEVKKNEEH